MPKGTEQERCLQNIAAQLERIADALGAIEAAGRHGPWLGGGGMVKTVDDIRREQARKEKG